MTENSPINPKNFFEAAEKNTVLSVEKKAQLQTIALQIAKTLQKNNEVHLHFICTHNSRRSQLAQVWGFYASSYFKLTNIHSFSGGTAVTAFYKNTVTTLQEVGFVFNLQNLSHSNPRYLIGFPESNKTLLGYSKLFNDPINTQPSIVITTCNNADENCPFIPAALQRFHLPYTDPKFADNTPEEQTAYLATNQEIAADIFTIFKEVKVFLSENR